LKLNKKILFASLFCLAIVLVVSASLNFVKADNHERPPLLFTGDTIAEDGYVPEQDSYHFSMIYKLVHPWYDFIQVGIDEAVDEYEELHGVEITYDWEAPVEPDAIAQVQKMEDAAGRNVDLIAVDVTEADTVYPVINEIMDRGIPVMTFLGSDAPRSERIAFLGNADNKGDGAKLAETLAESINYEGKVAALEGTIGAPSHEERIEGFNEVMAKYSDIEVVARGRDDDDLQKAMELTEQFIVDNPDLDGIWCNNATNPIGAAEVVVNAGLKDQITIVGMDHDIRTFEHIKAGNIKAAQVQNIFDMGYHSIKYAIKIADGIRPENGEIKEIYNVGSTTVTEDNVDQFMEIMYGE